MTDSPPIMILGAPRSGTSLLQHIVRSAPGFVSPVRESQHIWEPYVHPTLNDWRFEGVDPVRLREVDLDRIREQLFEQAISAKVWRFLRASGVYDSPGLMALARKAGRPVTALLSLLNSAVPKEAGSTRWFVDKSVHAGLWMDLVLNTLPGCKVLHITRDPIKAVLSMTQAWSDLERFQTYAVPVDGGTRPWCFGLPEGWVEYANLSNELKSSFQWVEVNERILDHAAQLDAEQRYHHVQLESLVGSPEVTISRLVEFMGCDASAYWRQLCEGLPVINPAEAGRKRGAALSSEARALVEPLRKRLGYT